MINRTRRMPHIGTCSSLLRWIVNAVGLLLFGYLAALARKPAILDTLPGWLSAV